MAVLIVKVPQDVARTLWGIPPLEEAEKGVPLQPDEWEPQAHAHITMIYFGKNPSWKVLGEAMGVIYEECLKTRPFPLYTSEVNKFPVSKHSKHRAPIICKVVSNELRDLQKRIWDSLEAADIDFAKNSTDYKPHVTLGYAIHEEEDPATEWDGIDIPTVSWGVHELTLWCGDDGDEKMSVTFPLTLGMKSSRVLTRHRMTTILNLLRHKAHLVEKS